MLILTQESEVSVQSMNLSRHTCCTCKCLVIKGLTVLPHSDSTFANLESTDCIRNHNIIIRIRLQHFGKKICYPFYDSEGMLGRYKMQI